MRDESAAPMRTVPVEVVVKPAVAVAVGITTGAVLAANSIRRGAVIVNVSTARISFGIGVPAELDKGITLYPQGVWEMDERSFTKSAINAIGSVVGALSVQEFE